jgi:regulator of sigma E protease
MHSFLISAVTVVVVLGVMILVHEFGHYAAAKFFGVRVEVFSIGFGKRLFGFKRGETDYRISALPLGGYVKMAGENPMESRTGDPGEFMSHPRWQRFIIAVAGPAMNIFLAVALLTGVYMVRYEHPVYLNQPAVVGWVVEKSAAARAGIEPGDKIVRIDGVQNPTWEEVMPKLLLSPGQPLDVAIQRGNEVFTKSITPDNADPEQFDNAGLLPDEPITVTQIEANMPAAQAGVRVGDEIVAINGVAMRSMHAIIRTIQENKDKPLELTVVRQEAGQQKQLKFTVTPMLSEVQGQKRYRLGFQSNPQHVDQLSFPAAFRKSLEQNKRYSLLIFELVHKMVQRKVSMRQIEGPIGIARASGEAVQQKGWTPLLALMAAISLNLGIFNLFPIPILDGGLILLLLVESVMRRDISQRIKERIYQAAFVFLILFAAMVIYNDLVKTLPGLAQRLP